MNKDTVRWLVDNHITSFGPQVSIMLINIAKEVAEKAKADKTASLAVRRELKQYAANMLDVAVSGGAHQGAVIEKLKYLLGNPPPGWTGAIVLDKEI